MSDVVALAVVVWYKATVARPTRLLLRAPLEVRMGGAP